MHISVYANARQESEKYWSHELSKFLERDCSSGEGVGNCLPDCTEKVRPNGLSGKVSVVNECEPDIEFVLETFQLSVHITIRCRYNTHEFLALIGSAYFNLLLIATFIGYQNVNPERFLTIAKFISVPSKENRPPMGLSVHQ